MPLATCLIMFRRWLAQMSDLHQIILHSDEKSFSRPNATCVTWLDWDLSFCLENECKRKQIQKTGCLSTWIDIRAVYRGDDSRLCQLGPSLDNIENYEALTIDNAQTKSKLSGSSLWGNPFNIEWWPVKQK